jgi:tRNA (guanine37-N1)-methyltransferase
MKDRGRAARGYDLYGNIAVIDSSPSRAKGVGAMVLRENKNIETVLRKGGAVSGRYRTRKLVYVSGKRSYAAKYRENGCTFVFDIRKTFFSTRLAYERLRVAKLAKDGERVIVMFAGVGPYSIEIAKMHKKSRVISIEINAAASKYARENARINKTPNVTVEQGDVRRFASKYAHFADRILMPLPMSSRRFLTVALKMCSGRCAIHYYAFCKEAKVRDEIRMLRSFFEKRKRKFKLIGWRKVRPYSAKEIEIAVDFLVH